MTPPEPSACNALVNVGPQINVVQVASEPPPATGGAVSDGTYKLTDLTIYTGVGGPAGAIPAQLSQTIAIHGTSADAITEVSGKSTAQSTTFITSGTSASMAGTCPTVQPPQSGTYTATAASLVLFLVNDQGNTVRYTYAP